MSVTNGSCRSLQQTRGTLDHGNPLMWPEPSIAVAHRRRGGNELALEGIAVVCCDLRDQRTVEGLYHAKRLCHHRSCAAAIRSRISLTINAIAFEYSRPRRRSALRALERVLSRG